MTAPVIVEIFTKDDCCLCEEAKDVLKGLQRVSPFELKEVDITRDEKLFERYKEEIPVVFINGRKAFKYRVDPDDMLRRLERCRTRKES